MSGMTLSELKPGQSGTIISIGGEQNLRSRLLDMGLTPRTVVTLKKTAPMGDPIEVCLRGYCLTLRKSDASHIEVNL